MIKLLMIVIAAVSASPTQAQPEAERRTVIISLKDGSELAVYSDTIKDDNDAPYKVELATPWKPQTRTIRNAEILDKKRERQQERENRMRTACEKDNFTYVNGCYIPSNEVLLAQKAKDWASTKTEPAADVTESVSSEPPVEQTAPKPASSAAGYWGAIATIVVMAAALIAIIAKTMLTSDDA